MTTVVLGWDGLDYDLLERYGLHEEFGAETARIDTLRNPELGKPHTWELWPSIITGLDPDAHGIHADEYITGGWSNPLVRLAARLSDPIPDAIRWRVGRAIRGAGATIEFEDDAYYRERSIETVFDNRRAFPLAIPNYRSHVDERFDITADRGAELNEYTTVDTDENGETVREASVAPTTFMGRIAADAGEKIGLVSHALDSQYDIVFVWLAFIDTAGHVAPTVSEPDAWMRRAYETGADYTSFVRDQLDEEDTLVCLSDHGLQEGEHTDTACIGSWPADVARAAEHVLDVADCLNTVTPHTAEARAGFTREENETDVVRERLEDLGYVG